MPFRLFLSSQLYIALVLAFFAQVARAENTLNVVVSIRPLHSIAANVMAGHGQPVLLLDGLQSPHSQSLRPSQLSIVNAADTVFWISPNLETSLARSIDAASDLETNPPVVDWSGLILFPMRSRANTTGQGTQFSSLTINDAHLWLDPQNAKLIAFAMAKRLGMLDPNNSKSYLDNAENFSQKIDALKTDIEQKLDGLEAKKFISFHDGFQYFDRRFKLSYHASLVLMPNHPPSARHLRALQTEIDQFSIRCIFTEPQFSDKLVSALDLEKNMRIVALDLLGNSLAPGSSLYIEMMRSIAADFNTCLS